MKMRMKERTLVHDAPWLRFSDPAQASAFFTRFGIDLEQHADMLLASITEAFKHVPYENLTKIIKADAVINASSAMRHPDEVIGDFLQWGTGGTCFSLTAAMVALLDIAGIDAWPILADRHYGADTHCGLIVAGSDGRVLLLDPGFLLFAPVVAPREHPLSYETGFNTVELLPRCGGARVELYTMVKGNRKLRLTFKMEPVSDEAFGRAWERSFAFEMMTYPVLTRHISGKHQYVQGDTLAVRDARRTERTVLTPEQMVDFICGSVHMNRAIVTRALEIVRHGTSAATVSR